jgi:DNA-binding NarL/FixJ family response regulator
MHNSTFLRPQKLSTREAEVTELLSEGLSEKEIASRLRLSVNTVINHLRRIKEKFLVQKSTEVVLVYLCLLRHVPFDLAKIREVGIEKYFGLGE